MYIVEKGIILAVKITLLLQLFDSKKVNNIDCDEIIFEEGPLITFVMVFTGSSER